MALFARSAKSTHFLAEREGSRLKIQYYNWTPKISPLDKWQNDWIASGVFEEGANSFRHALRCLVPSTLQQLLGAFSSPRQINGISIPGSPGIDIGTAPYCHRLLLRLNPLRGISFMFAIFGSPPLRRLGALFGGLPRPTTPRWRSL